MSSTSSPVDLYKCLKQVLLLRTIFWTQFRRLDATRLLPFIERCICWLEYSGRLYSFPGKIRRSDVSVQFCRGSSKDFHVCFMTTSKEFSHQFSASKGLHFYLFSFECVAMQTAARYLKPRKFSS